MRCHKLARSGPKLLGGPGKKGLQTVATSCMIFGRDRIKHYMSVVLACSHDGTEHRLASMPLAEMPTMAFT
jgi:hypothetical protein